MARIAYLWDPISLEHDTGAHVECIARAERLSPEQIRAKLPTVSLAPVEDHDTPRWITEVHAKSYHDWVKSSCKEGRQLLDQGDTIVCERSYEAALGSVNAALTAADLVMGGKYDAAFCAMRPPGHHALPDGAMGFCLFANISILARHLQKHHAVGKIAIVDWDVHHGNGTQAVFYDDPSVFFVSLHQSPLWPGTGMASERGTGDGRGFTLNVPIRPATTEAEYLTRFENEVLPPLRDFKPEFLLISAGFDAHRDDPLADLRLTESGFATMTRLLNGISTEFCQGRTISLLEGGYNLSALQASVIAHVQALSES